MKILLVVKSKKMETLGPMYLSAVIKQAGHECKIVEIEHAYHIAHVYDADVVGMSIMTGDMEIFKKLALSVKNRMGMMVVVGGPDPTFFPQGYEWADHVVRGEGENWMTDFLKVNKSFPDIDSFPWPDRTDFPDMKIRDFITSRGCGGVCSYCYNQRWAEMFPEIPRIRVRSVNDVIAEINSVSPEFVYFQDSCFGVDMKWLREFSKQYHAKINIPFHCHLRPNQVNEERVALLSEAGCMSIRIALESASPRLRKILNRGKMNLDQVQNAVKLLKTWNIEVMVQNMLACPTSTIEDDLETLEFNIRCNPSYAWCSIFAPYPGTALGDQCVKEGWFKGDYNALSDSFFDRSVLEFSEEYKEQTYYLQKVFALCVETETLPETWELSQENFPQLVHRIMRKMGDTRLYGGVI